MATQPACRAHSRATTGASRAPCSRRGWSRARPEWPPACRDAASTTADGPAITQRGAPGAEGDLALPAEVEVTDPAHPLHGRRFRLLSASRTVQTAGHAWVEYRPGALLMLPIPAKLCLEALEDLVATAGESEGACPSSPATSGEPCRPASAGKSSRTSPRST